MLIYTEQITPRLQYVADFIFRDNYGIEFRIIDDAEEFRLFRGPKLAYATKNPGDAFWMLPSGLLAGDSIREIDPAPVTAGELPILFPGKPSDLDFDLFAAVFYMISRYEEYLPFEPDRFGRFPASESLAFRHGFLELPVVDLWTLYLREKLAERFDELSMEEGDFRFLPTCDIDLPYAYLHRGWARTLATRLKARLKSTEDDKIRLEVLSGRSKDPFDTYGEIEAVHSLHSIRPRIFFLTSRYGKYDKSISPESKAFKSLVRRTMKFADIGIHPSFRASDNSSLLNRELKTLSFIAETEITHSRQHYLKFRVPENHRAYLAAGIREEYSMGFASATGFRAGTSRTFNFYDLGNDKETELRITPFQVMDRTLKDYMALSPEQSIHKIRELVETTRSVGGCFSSIWHNDAFSDYGEWKGWKDVYLQMMDMISG